MINYATREKLVGLSTNKEDWKDLSCNAILAKQKLLETHEKSKSDDLHPYAKHIKALATIATPDVYKAGFNRWKSALERFKKMGKPVSELEATTRSPLAIGLGNASPYEVGLTLHHTYGVPYLPGSALKGLALRVARQHAKLSEKEVETIFGNTDAAGYITFWDGWMDAGAQNPLQLDTITVHHPDYYQKGTAFPTDFDDPNPVAFLSVKPGVKFHIALSGPEDWVGVAAQLLEYGLCYLGLGGKTNAGYGGFAVEREKSEAEKAQQTAEDEKRAEAEKEAFAKQQQDERAQKYLDQISTLNNSNEPDVVSRVINETKQLPAASRKHVLQTLLERLEQRNSKQKLRNRVIDELKKLS